MYPKKNSIAAIGVVLLAIATADAQQCGDRCPVDCRRGDACGHVMGLDPSLPHPCTADGICYPKRNTHGYYAQRWRRWPGVADDPLPNQEAQGESILKPFETPDPTIEDRQAPPPSEDPDEEEAAGEFGEGGDEMSLPPLPPARPFGAPAPGGAAPAGDQPPLLPFERPAPGGFSPPPSGPPAATPPTTPRPGGLFGPQGRVKLRKDDSDGPPPLPMSLTQLRKRPMARLTAGVVSDEHVQPVSVAGPVCLPKPQAASQIPTLAEPATDYPVKLQ